MIVFGDAPGESSAGPFEQAAALSQTITTLSTGPAARSFYDTLLVNLFCHVLGLMGGWGNQT
jgi:hypothetical protein